MVHDAVADEKKMSTVTLGHELTDERKYRGYLQLASAPNAI